MPPDGIDALNAETRVRRALGLPASSFRLPQQSADSARQRHRFGQNGEVPVVMPSGGGKSDAAFQGGNRPAELVAALDAERAAQASAARSLEKALATIRSLQTRLAHAELAFEEAIAFERRARAEAEKALQEAMARGTAPEDVRDAAAGRSAEARIKRTAAARTEVAGAAPKASATPKKREPQPVKWWTSSSRARTGRTPAEWL